MGRITYPGNTLDTALREQLQTQERLGICTFCEELADPHIPNLASTEGWVLRRSRPLVDIEGNRVETVLHIICKQHLTTPQELGPSDWAQIGALQHRAVEALNAKHLFFYCRMGSAAGSLHAHLRFSVVVPEIWEGDEEAENPRGRFFNIDLGTARPR